MKKGSLKKFLSLGMAVSIGTAALTGCGDTSSGETEQAMAETRGMETEIAETDSKEQKEDKREVPTLVWWTVGNTAPDDFGEAVEQISDYVEEK